MPRAGAGASRRRLTSLSKSRWENFLEALVDELGISDGALAQQGFRRRIIESSQLPVNDGVNAADEK